MAKHGRRDESRFGINSLPLHFPPAPRVQNCATNVRQFWSEGAEMRIIGYERVSTARQGASGLGIEAQRQAIDGFVRAARRARSSPASPRWRAAATPTGRSWSKALHLAKVTGATLVIAKLDRLSRNAAFLLTLRDSGVRFAAVDLPEANDLTVGIMALVAQQEREAISRRTKEALAVARSRGVQARQPQRHRGAQAGWQGRCAAPGGHRAQRRAACAGPGAGGRGHPGRRRDQPAGDRGGAERPRHADPPRRALARLDGDEPARPARAQGGGMRQSRLMSLVEAIVDVAVCRHRHCAGSTGDEISGGHLPCRLRLRCPPYRHPLRLCHHRRCFPYHSYPIRWQSRPCRNCRAIRRDPKRSWTRPCRSRCVHGRSRCAPGYRTTASGCPLQRLRWRRRGLVPASTPYPR